MVEGGEGREENGEVVIYLASIDVGGGSGDFEGCCGCEGGDERSDDDCGAHFEGWEDEVEGVVGEVREDRKKMEGRLLSGYLRLVLLMMISSTPYFPQSLICLLSSGVSSIRNLAILSLECSLFLPFNSAFSSSHNIDAALCVVSISHCKVPSLCLAADVSCQDTAHNGRSASIAYEGREEYMR
tara:strand:+ start:28781 stop:29332 length:552 start_codon:yes stop_codon:yes gene_type:complete